jgi:hypothetical protein
MRNMLDLDMVDMAWEVINIDYMIADWRQDMDVEYMRTQETATTTTEMDHVTLLLGELWIKDRRLRDPDIMMAKLELDSIIADLYGQSGGQVCASHGGN